MVDVSHSYNVNCLTLSTILKNKDKMKHVNSVVPMILTILSKKHGRVMERMEKLQSVDAETTSVLRPTQFKSDSRKLKAF